MIYRDNHKGAILRKSMFPSLENVYMRRQIDCSRGVMNTPIILEGDCLEVLPSLKDAGVNLIITSPPYNVGMDYANTDDRRNTDLYWDWTEKWLRSCWEMMPDDGRLCLNVPIDVNRPEKFPFSARYSELAMKVGWEYHTTILWDKHGLARESTAWGSWLSPSAPSVTPRLEVVIVLYKKDWKLNRSGVTDMTRYEFMTLVRGHWKFPSESAKRVGHPAPFPSELPRRCMKLFSYIGDTVLDPFAGSGTTLFTAYDMDRHSIGIEIAPEYCDMMRKRKDGLSLRLPFEG